MAKNLKTLNTFFKLLKIDNFLLAGSSLGGWLSWEYALKYKKQVKKLLLVSSAGFLDQRSIPLPFKMARTPFINKIVKYAFKKNVMEKFLRQVYAHPEKVTQELMDRYYDLFTKEGNPEAFYKMVNSGFKDNTNKLKRLKCPTLIMWGEGDKWIPVANAYRFHDLIPDAKLIVYENVGHIPMEEFPQVTAVDAANFLMDEIQIPVLV